MHTKEVSGVLAVNEENRIVLKVEEEEYAIHFTDIEKHKLNLKKNSKPIPASGLGFIYQTPFNNLAGYIYPCRLVLEKNGD